MWLGWSSQSSHDERKGNKKSASPEAEKSMPNRTGGVMTGSKEGETENDKITIDGEKWC